MRRSPLATGLPCRTFLPVCCWLTVLLCPGAYLESDTAGGEPRRAPAQRVVPPPRPEPVPRGVAEDILRFVSRLRVLRPQHHRGLVLFPLVLSGHGDGRRYRSLDDALAHGSLDIRDSGRVHEVRVRNRSRDVVFMMGGETLAGGKQNRMLREDVLLLPRSGEILVPTYCVEHGRWSEGPAFRSGGYLPSHELRGDARRGVTQEAVWDRIRRTADRFSVQSGTEDLGEIVGSRGVRSQLEEVRRGFDRLWRDRPLGLVAADATGILGMDVFCNEWLFSDLRDKVVDSYAMSVLARGLGRPAAVRREDVERLLARIRRARFLPAATPGAGVGARFRGSGLEGRGLLFQGSTVHLELSASVDRGRLHWP